uniref:ORFC n=1 Tax=Bolocera sp. BZ-2016 TaxID=1920238 RepID=A0A1L5YIP0_9CNID|nr:ORFC [Bolocera sp. BZ-2016]
MSKPFLFNLEYHQHFMSGAENWAQMPQHVKPVDIYWLDRSVDDINMWDQICPFHRFSTVRPPHSHF